MFWKKRQVVADTTKVDAGAAAPPAAAKVKPAKEKKLSPKEVLAEEVASLAAGGVITYHFAETFGGAMIHVELNPQYPGKGRKYTVAMEKIVAGKPCGKKSVLWDSNNAKEIASWIIDRDGEPAS